MQATLLKIIAQSVDIRYAARTLLTVEDCTATTLASSDIRER
jgi:hypothetical protein